MSSTTRPRTRSGCDAADCHPCRPPIECPISAALVRPSAAIASAMSATMRRDVQGPRAPERPCPRASRPTTRPRSASHCAAGHQVDARPIRPCRSGSAARCRRTRSPPTPPRQSCAPPPAQPHPPRPPPRHSCGTRCKRRIFCHTGDVRAGDGRGRAGGVGTRAARPGAATRRGGQAGGAGLGGGGW